MANPLTFREVVEKLKKYDKDFEIYGNRAKESERMIYHPNIDGRSESFPMKCHREGAELRKGVLSVIIRRFSLPRDIF
jgi:hypothetical protein